MYNITFQVNGINGEWNYGNVNVIIVNNPHSSMSQMGKVYEFPCDNSPIKNKEFCLEVYNYIKKCTTFMEIEDLLGEGRWVELKIYRKIKHNIEGLL